MSKFKSQLANALEDRGVNAQVIDGITQPKSRTTGKNGKYVRLTITMRPDQFKRLEKIRAEIVAEAYQAENAAVDFNKMELCRWLLDVAFEEYDSGARPTFEKRLAAAGE